ncbi:phosphatidylinositol N-acetylglucosaminyltransferase subunit Q [Nymphalis io]|uniref:phosphatidylinositol N-acetylglucosaminyltransferase subunit Q n=1 Tax=Inachis io TaxID=171585 RepID=UPI00216769A1|nr:phosphatidylinositol N-acetylglucosaminyltransferase subunit Q [Nymphalis io]
MPELVRILLPVLPNGDKDIFYKGYFENSDQNCITIFITIYAHSPKIFKSNQIKENVIFGYSSDNVFENKHMKTKNQLITDRKEYPQIKSLIIKGKPKTDADYIIMLYDYNKVRNSETISNSDDYFLTLQGLIHKDAGDRCNIFCEPSYMNNNWFTSSMFVQHAYNYIYLLKWLLNSVRNKGKVSIKQGNLLLAILVDVILGYLVLQLVISSKKDLGVMLMGILEKLVNLMYSLLKWLMGDPAGLKLNNAFNKMLGKYFLYHVELWWLFIDVSGEKLDVILHLYQYIGYLGFTFQAAIISDMICLATFHSYCIYVYAARLFNIQISGLKALLRLFVGRKYNPLRGGIDSCEYTNQELFVGTVAFTILLLLLPTTVMYYIVFTMFRVLSLVVQYVLAKIIYTIQTLPFYVIVLWLSQSPKLAGNILIEEIETVQNTSSLILKVKLFNKSFKDLMKNFRPPVHVSKNIEWSNIVSNIFTGKQIV